MQYKKIAMAPRKKIALVAHDNKKQDLFEWVKFNRGLLAHHDLYATGTTGTVLGEELDLEIVRLESGPEDGKTLTKIIHRSGPRGESEQKYVLEKQ